MFTFSILCGLINLLGGRWDDVWKNPKINGRLLWRCIIMGIVSGVYAFEHQYGLFAIYVWFAVTTGSALWFPFDWSFTEINKIDDPKKYSRWVRWIGVQIFPLDDSTRTNILRAILMKGIRGAFDMLTFALLLPVNHYAMLFWLGTFSMGAVYWAASKIYPGMEKDVIVAEDCYGMVRGLLIGGCIAMGSVANLMQFYHWMV